MTKRTIYLPHWNPKLEAGYARIPVHDFSYLFYQLKSDILKLFPDTEVVVLPNLENEVTILGETVMMSDCDFIVTVDDTIRMLSFSDRPSKAQSCLFNRQNTNDILVWCNYQTFDHLFTDTRFVRKTSPYIARHAYINHDAFYHFRDWDSLIDKMVFRGNYQSLPRNAVNSLMTGNNKQWFSGPDGIETPGYFENLIAHKVGLAITGAAELSHREIEYMAVGLPILRFELLSRSDPCLVSNVHYIAVSRLDGNIDDELWCGRENRDSYAIGPNEATDRYAEAFVTRFLEVKDDIEYLKYVAQNARDYYTQYLDPRNRTSHFLNLLEIA